MKKTTKKWYDAAILQEDETNATEYSKHFILNNGTRKAVFSPVRLQNFDPKEQKWREVNHALQAIDGGYRTDFGNYTLKLLQNEAVEVTDGVSSVSWEYIGTSRNVFLKSAGKSGTGFEKRKSKLKVKRKIPGPLELSTASRAVFQDAEGDVDLDYSIEGDCLKETIIVKEKAETYRYYFSFRVSGLRMVPSEGGSRIAFYKDSDGVEDAENASPEFVMPAPMMYDAAGSASDQVAYSMEAVADGNYIFSVQADADWINAPERVFPVQIDPQFTVSGMDYLNITQTRYQYETCSSCSSGEWIYAENPSYDCLYLYRNTSTKINATVRIKRGQIDLSIYRILSAKLIFIKDESQSGSSSGLIRVGNTYYGLNTERLTANITNLYKSGTGDLDLEMEMVTDGSSRFTKTPTLEIEYQPINGAPVVKTIDVGAGVHEELDVLSGCGTTVIDDISDPALGVSVSHVYKPNSEFSQYGVNNRLNLDEKLEKAEATSTGAQYVYTDPHGNKHTFKEQFYRIGTNGEKVPVTENVGSILADANGQLWLNSKEVYRELTAVGGLRAAARLEGANNAEWLEQRIDEEKQLEEQVKSYENTLTNFVLVKIDTGNIVQLFTNGMLASPDEYESFIRNRKPCCAYLLTKEEALSYRSLMTQKDSLIASRTALSLQKDSLKNSAKGLYLQLNSADVFAFQEYCNTFQYHSLNVEKDALNIQLDSNKGDPYETLWDNLYNVKKKLLGWPGSEPFDYTQYQILQKQMALTAAQKADLAAQKELIEQQINQFPLGSSTNTNFGLAAKGTLTLQYENTQTQIAIISKQITDLNRQIDLLAQKSEKYVEQLNTLYKEYCSVKNKYETLKMQIPVSYLISDGAVKGFNADGRLVVVQDRYGNYAAVEREIYTQEGAVRIASVTDQDGRSMIFRYNGENRLSEIVNSAGEKTAFRYDTNGYLIAVERDQLPSLTVSYSSGLPKRIQKISTADHHTASYTYQTAGALLSISRSTTVKSISHGEVAVQSTSTSLSALTIAYTVKDTKLTYDQTRMEIYKTDQVNNRVDAYYELVNSKVSHAEFYTYSGSLRTKTEYAAKSCLNRFSYTDFGSNFAIETVESIAYNTYDEPALAERARYAVPRTGGDCPVESTQTVYTYNNDRKLKRMRTIHQYGCCGSGDSTVTVEEYDYNSMGDLVRTERYVEGEELISGKQVEEHVYNAKGIETQSFAYNTLDPSSKYVTEREVDETGRVTAEVDGTGEHRTAMEYARDGVTLRSECLPNGSKRSYGGAKDGSSSAVTHSTAEGEENSTQSVCTADVVTELRSGNNRICYQYDGKRRVKSVSLNGTDDYVKYAYSGEHTNAETVTATMKNGVVCSSVKDYYGNVTKVTCGGRSVTNKYDADNQLTQMTDSVSGITSFGYDGNGNVTSVQSTGCSEQYTYDPENVLQGKTVTASGSTHTYEYVYSRTGAKELDSIGVGSHTVRILRDALGRNTGKKIENGAQTVAEEKISYLKYGDRTTNLPGTVRYAKNVNGKPTFTESLQYRYDCMGNIVEISENGIPVCRYEYDALGRLTREDNKAFAKTKRFVYDNNGNLTARYEYAITAKPTAELYLLDGTCTRYAYADDSDMLLSYGEEAFAYDSIGNPTTYRGKSATWQYGRQLTAYNGNTFTYDARGRRTGKNSIAYTYDSAGNLIKQSNGLEFLYDHTGVFAIKYGNSTYYYRKNAQNDVRSLLDSSGAVVVQYDYDAWGNCKTTVVNSTCSEIAILNPFRYRSYYYDTETKFYFLQSRYYDPEIGRFLTIDDISYLNADSVNGLNLYAYCGNNPVMSIDPNGTFVITLTALLTGALISAGVGVGLALGSTIYMDYKDDGKIFNGSISIWSYIGNIVGGAIAGAGIGVCIALGAGLGASLLGFEVLTAGLSLSGGTALAIGSGMAFVTGGLGYFARTSISDQESFKLSDMFIEAGSNLVSGILSFAGGIVGGMFGAKIPGAKFSMNDFMAFQLTQVWYGVYPSKLFLAYFKNRLKEIW